MGAIFFYIFIYFIGYYGSNVLNMFTVRPLITNRYMAALFPVYGVALTHVYVIVSSPPPQGTDITVEYALLVFITLPVVIVTLGAIYFMWNNKCKSEVSTNHNENTLETTSAESSDLESRDGKLENKEINSDKSKDN